MVGWLSVDGRCCCSPCSGLLAPGRRGLKLVLVGWTVLAFARMYDQPPLLGHVLGVLPAMSRIQFYRYGTAALELPVIVLAALGLDDLARVPAHRRRLLWGASGGDGRRRWRPRSSPAGRRFARRAVFRSDAFFYASVIWGLLIPALVAAVALLRQARLRAALLTCWWRSMRSSCSPCPSSRPRARRRVDLAPVAYLRRHLGESRFFTLGPIAPELRLLLRARVVRRR